MMERLDNLWIRLGVLALLGAVVLGWTELVDRPRHAARTDRSSRPAPRVPPPSNVAPQVETPVDTAARDDSGQSASLETTARRNDAPSRPRLFLARDRVRRLPPLGPPGEEICSAAFPAEAGEPSPEAEQGAAVFDERRTIDGASSQAGPRLLAPMTAPLDSPEDPQWPLADLPHELPDDGLSSTDAPTRLPKTSQTATPDEAPRRLPMRPPAVAAEDAWAEGSWVDPFSPAPPGHETAVPAPSDAPRAAATAGPQPRSEQLERIAREADQHTRRGFELAGRKAYYAARAEFIVALRLMAQALDSEYRTDRHSRALAAGLRAVREADDFIPGRSRLEADLDLSTIAGSHRTPALKNADLRDFTPMTALQAYFTYAQDRLADAAGGELAASMALHGLGKLHSALVEEPTVEIVAPEPKAMTYFQAALLAFPGNLMAANDLGVLLARSGNWRQARRFLEHAVRLNPRSASWENLAKVYRVLGDRQAEAHAARQVAQLWQQNRGRPITPPARGVVWLNPTVFAGTHAQQGDAMVADRPTAQAASAVPPAVARQGWTMSSRRTQQ